MYSPKFSLQAVTCRRGYAAGGGEKDYALQAAVWHAVRVMGVVCT